MVNVINILKQNSPIFVAVIVALLNVTFNSMWFLLNSVQFNLQFILLRAYEMFTVTAIGALLSQFFIKGKLVPKLLFIGTFIVLTQLVPDALIWKDATYNLLSKAFFYYVSVLVALLLRGD